MKILIADDQPAARFLLETTLARAGHEVVPAADGTQAWEQLTAEGAPRLAVLDNLMPGLSGLELCRRIRQSVASPYVYVILLTARGEKKDLIEGFEAGADDYIVKPFDHEDLVSRVRVGERILNLESALAGKVRELEHALAQVRQLEGLLPICMHCRKIRDEVGAWTSFEAYVTEHSGARFTHGLCSDCRKRHYPDFPEGTPLG